MSGQGFGQEPRRKQIEDIIKGLSPEELKIFMSCLIQIKDNASPRDIDRMMETVPQKVKMAIGDFVGMWFVEAELKEKTEKKKAEGKEIRATALEILTCLIRSDGSLGLDDTQLVDRAVFMAERLHEFT